jgi:hypothetical protein
MLGPFSFSDSEAIRHHKLFGDAIMSLSMPMEQRDQLLKGLDMDTNAATGESQDMNAEELQVQEQVRLSNVNGDE